MLLVKSFNRIARRDIAGSSEKYYFNASNRITQCISFEGLTTQYAYNYDFTAGETWHKVPARFFLIIGRVVR